MRGNNWRKTEQLVSVQPSPSPPPPPVRIPNSAASASVSQKIEKRIKYIWVNSISPQPKKKKKKELYWTKSVEREEKYVYTLPQFRLIREDDEESAKVMKLFLNDSRKSFWLECPFNSGSLCKLLWLLVVLFLFSIYLFFSSKR